MSSREPSPGGTAVPTMRCATCAALSFGYRARISAACPDTTAAAKLVPLTVTNLPPGGSAVSASPGAATEIHEPVLDWSSGAPASLVAATATTPG